MNILNAYQIYTTGDGSPTLFFTREADNYIEKMHNAKGAYAESLYIYGDSLDSVLDRAIDFSGNPLTIGSLGLGLAYNEIISVARLVKYQKTKSQVVPYRLISFEKDQSLTNELLKWLNEQPTALTMHYDWILQQTAKDHDLTSSELKQTLKKSIDEKNWQIRGEFPQQLTSQDQFHLFYYDAFSNKMSPELWTDEVLNDFIRNHTAAKCLISTYAATGALKRALKTNDFKLSPRPGFGGKRESILGIR